MKIYIVSLLHRATINKANNDNNKAKSIKQIIYVHYWSEWNIFVMSKTASQKTFCVNKRC